MSNRIDIVINSPTLALAFHTAYLDKLIQDGYVYVKDLFEITSKNEIIKRLNYENSEFSSLIELYRKQKNYLTNEQLASLVKYNSEGKVNNNLSDTECKAIINLVLGLYSKNDDKYEFLLNLSNKITNDKFGFCNPDETKSKREFIGKKDISITSVDNLISFLRFIKDLNISNKYRTFYRGHSRLNYLLLPSIMRTKELLLNEYKIYNELLVRCPNDFVGCKSHIDILTDMQHYGLPTRMLDITTNPLAALYFACCSNEKANGEVVIFTVGSEKLRYANSDTVTILSCLPLLKNQMKENIFTFVRGKKDNTTIEKYGTAKDRLLHEIKTEKPSFEDRIIESDLINAFVVYPNALNNRIIRQNGAFIICGILYKDSSFDEHNDTIDLMRYCNKDSKKIVLVITKKRDILKELNSLNINKASLFPEIDQVANYITANYNIL
ncbi:MAG: FRG domain-containing protein [Clostridiales bacterium]|jgi:hypothetical protein|nr:FRG domain-containing protein [Clostridiales bacterium]MCI1951508.1 FRG domain-containing protein [Clostridiales bacterium]MCI1960637.1 FRG domain-containing protein [Clostridiales bacterium]MCI1960683.1 FRG domain-containing protein [Clostridiales bacterium]MCI2021124.1 FRG domain-containing protein [Clostridiales bacterium]